MRRQVEPIHAVAGLVDGADPIAIGDVVQRGPGWLRERGDQDGGAGNFGHVTQILDGEVVVAWWKNAEGRNYRWSPYCYEVQKVPGVPSKAIEIGDRVLDLRGRSGAQLRGTVAAVDIKRGYVMVQWSHQSTAVRRTWGVEGVFEVEVTEKVSSYLTMEVGRIVVRGCHWPSIPGGAQAEEESSHLGRYVGVDVQETGKVLRYSKSDGTVAVMWLKSEVTAFYKYGGADGLYEVQLAPLKQQFESSGTKLRAGDVVRRGPDWLKNQHRRKSADAEKTIEKEGFVTQVDNDSTIFVMWDNGIQANYVYDDEIKEVELVAGDDSKKIKVGDRVVRGPNWKKEYKDNDGKDQDRNGQGTVIKSSIKEGAIWVLWDCGHRNRYTWGCKSMLRT